MAFLIYAWHSSFPASHVRGVTATYWFIDDAAAQGLPESYHCDL